MKRRIRNNHWFLCLLLSLAPLWLAAGAESDTNNVPHTLAELNRWYVEPPTNENGAVYFLQAGDSISRDLERRYYTNNGSGRIFTNILFPFSHFLTTNGPLSRATKTAIAPFLERVKQAWPVLQQGAECAQSRYPVDLNEGWKVSTPHQMPILVNERFCALFVLSQADARQAEPAANGILMILALAHSLDAEPLISSQNLRGTCLEDAVSALEQTINRVNLPTNTLEQLQRAFDEVEKQETKGDSFLRAWTGVRLIEESYFDLPTNELSELATRQIKANPWITNYTIAKIPGLVERAQKTKADDRQFMDRMFAKIITDWQEGYPQRLNCDEIFSSGMDEMARRQFGFILGSNPGSVGVATIEGSVLVHLRLAQTAIALERYRAAHENQYPESLGALVPEYLPAIPESIFSDPDSALHYQRHSHDYLLYAAGPDWANDRGEPDREIRFRVTNPPGRAVIE